jgi:predicted kinase
MKVILTKGLPASGKTTWAKELIKSQPGKWKRVNKDDLRAMVDGGVWSKQNESFIVKIRDIVAAESLIHGYSVIIDDTNFNPQHEETFKDMAHDLGAEFEIKDFTDVPLDECIKRDMKRSNSVGEKVIKTMYKKYLLPDPITIEHDESLPDAIICDIDGTVALMKNRSPYDASTCENDDPNTLIVGILQSYIEGLSNDLMPRPTVLFVSGREDKFREKTEEWLKKWITVPGWSLFMRPTGDFRKDNIVKKEIYEDMIKDKYNVYFVLDDRDRVVRMWREQGLKCLQVANGDF